MCGIGASSGASFIPSALDPIDIEHSKRRHRAANEELRQSIARSRGVYAAEMYLTNRKTKKRNEKLRKRGWGVVVSIGIFLVWLALIATSHGWFVIGR